MKRRMLDQMLEQERQATPQNPSNIRKGKQAEAHPFSSQPTPSSQEIPFASTSSTKLPSSFSSAQPSNPHFSLSKPTQSLPSPTLSPLPSSTPEPPLSSHPQILRIQKSDPSNKKLKQKRKPFLFNNRDSSSVEPEDDVPLIQLLPREVNEGTSQGPDDTGYPSCWDVSNAVLSCYPLGNTTIAEDIWSKFIWNANYPTFQAAEYVDVYLYNANDDSMVQSWTSQVNSEGAVGFQATEGIFPAISTWSGENITVPYYFVVIPATTTLDGGEPHQSTFEVIQTSIPTSLVSSISAASASSVSAASSVSGVQASLSSLESVLSSILSVEGISPNGTAASGSSGGPSSLQNHSSGSNFPKWAIALLVIFGLLALLAGLVAAYFFIRFARQRRNSRLAESSSSLNSGTPMMKDVGATGMGGNVGGGGVGKGLEEGAVGGLLAGGIASRRKDDREEDENIGMMSSEGGHSSRQSSGADTGPITAADAATMADAFRKALRKPEFPNDPSPGTTDSKGGKSSSGILDSGLGGAGGNNGESTDNDYENVSGSPSGGGLGSGFLTGMGLGGLASLISTGGGDRHSGDMGQGLDEEDGDGEGQSLMAKELQSEGRSMRSNTERKRAEILSSDEGE